MSSKSIEWLKQADYDMETAEFMFSGGRFFYAVFMGHQSIEKALKGLYQKRLEQIPPKTHNLMYLLQKMGLRPDETMGKSMARLSEANITTRYPEDIERLQADYTQAVTRQILDQSKDILEWIKQKY